MTLTAASFDPPLADAGRLLSSGRWGEARAAYEASLAHEESPQAWDGLGWAAFWLSDEAATLRAREAAYRGYRLLGDPRAAGAVAGWLAGDYREFRGELAIARGWLERAHRLLDPLPEGPEHGWLALNEASHELAETGDAEVAGRIAERAARIGRQHHVPDIEAVGLAQQGIAAVIGGRVADGMRLLDEASVVAAGEHLQNPLSQGWALCYLITACDGVGDFPRAAQWCQVMRDVSEHWDSRQLVGVCRASYGRVLATSGDWTRADVELVAAVGELQAARPAQAPRGLARLGELRARQGRADEARDLLTRAGSDGVLGLGELALDVGDADGAADAAERVLRRLPAAALLTRMPALELLVRARAEQRRVPEAQEAFEELERAGAQLGTSYVVGRVRLAAARVAFARDDFDGARCAAEDAVDRLCDGGAPYDAAVARLELARALAASDRADAAVGELRSARDAFVALGAGRELARAEALLAPASAVAAPAAAASSPAAVASPAAAVSSPAAGASPAAAVSSPAAGASPAALIPPDLDELSAREVEVLRLVAQGLGDAEIAVRLVLSPHTVHRHVANIRTKLRLPSRTAAVAYAARAGLL